MSGDHETDTAVPSDPDRAMRSPAQARDRVLGVNDSHSFRIVERTPDTDGVREYWLQIWRGDLGKWLDMLGPFRVQPSLPAPPRRPRQ
jgi:hypothetical protein